jgi:hypothetical protein
MTASPAAGAGMGLRLGFGVQLACLLQGGPAAADDTAKERLRGLSWIEGKNVRFDYRWAEGDDSRYPALAARPYAADCLPERASRFRADQDRQLSNRLPLRAGSDLRGFVRITR